jgi:hypothetical protein
MRDFAQDMSQALTTAKATISQQADMINRVRELHKSFDTSKSWLSPDYGICCMACEVNGMAVEYPCPTIKALDANTIGAPNE